MQIVIAILIHKDLLHAGCAIFIVTIHIRRTVIDLH